MTTAAPPVGPELAAVRDGDVWRFDTALPAPPAPVESLEAPPTPDVDEPSTTVAAAIPVQPPPEWFADPGLDGPTALTVTADGRVYGHAAAWGVRHIGLPGCRTAPRSTSGYRYYRTGQVECQDGSMVATGRITLGTGHADLNGNLTAASEHYDNTGAAVADVACGEDAHGIWFAGALRPDVTPEQIRALRASALSGDWRPAGHHLEMVGLLAVNVPGFPTPRAALAASGAEVSALVAAGVVLRADTDVPTDPPAPPAEPVGDTDTPSQEDPVTDTAPAQADPVLAAGDGGSDEGDSAPAPAYSSGDRVTIGDTGLSGTVTGSSGDDVTVEVNAPASMLTRAEEATTASGAEVTVAALQAITASLATITERLDRQDAERRADRGREVLDALDDPDFLDVVS